MPIYWHMLPLVLALLAAIGAGPQFARSIAWVVEHDAPPAGHTREQGAALLVVYGWEETRLAHCAFQVHATGARAKQLDADPLACVRAAYAVLRESYRICGDGPGYCGACRGKAAGAIAERRERRAAALLERLTASTTAPSAPRTSS